MRLRTVVPLFAFFVVGCAAGCVVKEYDGPPPANTYQGAPPATPAPATNSPSTGTAPNAATPTTVAPPTGAVANGPAVPSGGTTGIVPAGTGGPAGPMTTGNTGKIAGGAAPAMNKANDFGQAQPFSGAIPGTVYALPTNTTALPTLWNTLTTVATLYTQAWNVSPRDFKEGFPGVPGDRVEWFAIRWNGTIHVNTANKYHFKVNSDDGCKLYLDGALVVNDDGVHPPKIAEGDVVLTAGTHNLVIEYFQGPKWQIALQIWVSGPNFAERVLTTSF